MRDLAGYTAILTGAAGGIGPFIARALAVEQMNLVLAARSANEIESVASQICRDGVRIITVQTDVADPAALSALVGHANHEFGAIDVLVNNAGINNVLPYQKLRSEDIERIIRVNLVGPMLLAWMLLPGMLERRRGHIVNISSLGGKVGPPFCEPYAATKAGLIGFTESLRKEYLGTGISASVICPGFVTAGQYQKLVEETGLDAPRIVGTSSPESVARAVVQAIKKDIPEILVNPLRTTLLVKIAKTFPSMSEWLMQSLGVVDWLRKVAEIRAGKIVRSRDDT